MTITAHDVPTEITRDFLVSHDVPVDQIELFVATFGERMRLTHTNLERVIEVGFHLHWLAEQLLPPQAWTDFLEASNQADTVYEAATANRPETTAFNAVKRQAALIWKAETAQAQTEYEAATAQFTRDYKAVIGQALREAFAPYLVTETEPEDDQETRDVPTEITRDFLVKNNAGTHLIGQFTTTFGERARLTRDNIDRAIEAGLNLEWIAKQLLPDTTMTAYQATVDQARIANKAATRPAGDVFHTATLPARIAYSAATAQANRDYEATFATELTAYNAALDQALREAFAPYLATDA